jgi:hypothetical protein
MGEVAPQRPTARKRARHLLDDPSVRRRLGVAGAAYAVAAAFLLVVGLLRWLQPALSWTVMLALAAVIAAPLALAFVYDRLTALKTPWFEVTLTAATVEVQTQLAAAVQKADSSYTEDLIDYISKVMGQGGAPVVEVNLGTRAPYWWSTRLYLLAALAADYTPVQRLIFVTGGAEHRYLGMATPAGTRRLLATQFPAYEQAYLEQRAEQMQQSPKQLPQQQIRQILNVWPHKLPSPGQDEAAVKVLVTAELLQGWLEPELVPSSVEWDGWPEDRRMRYRILDEPTEYVALVRDGRLYRIVSRLALAAPLAKASLLGRSL